MDTKKVDATTTDTTMTELQELISRAEDCPTGFAAFVAAMMALYNDIPEKPVDAVIFHARASGDDDGLFALASELCQAGMAKKIIVNGGDGTQKFQGDDIPAWPGADDYLVRLKDAGVRHGKDGSDIIFSARADNTRAENDAFLKVMMDHGFKSGIVIAQPHQLPRAFAGMLAAMRLARMDIDLYAAAPSNVDWDKNVRGSPRAGEKPRWRHVYDEMAGIKKYTDQGHLVPLSYINLYRGIRDARKDFELKPL